MNYPRSVFDTLGGMVYFPRMLDKIRLKQRGELSDYYFEMLGKGFDGRLCRYLGINYSDVVSKVEAGATDDDILAWSREAGFPIAEEHVTIWNGFSLKRGDNDDGAPTLARFKQEQGLQDRDDIRTFFEFIEVDEKRRL